MRISTLTGKESRAFIVRRNVLGCLSRDGGPWGEVRRIMSKERREGGGRRAQGAGTGGREGEGRDERTGEGGGREEHGVGNKGREGFRG